MKKAVFMRGESQPRLFSLLLLLYHNHFPSVVLFMRFLQLSRIFQFYKIMTMSENRNTATAKGTGAALEFQVLLSQQGQRSAILGAGGL